MAIVPTPQEENIMDRYYKYEFGMRIDHLTESEIELLEDIKNCVTA